MRRQCGDSGDGPPRIEACEAFFVGDAICAIPDFDVRAKLEGCAGDPTAGGCHAGSNRILTVMELDLTNPSSTVEGELTPLIDMLSSNGSYLLGFRGRKLQLHVAQAHQQPGDWFAHAAAAIDRVHLEQRRDRMLPRVRPANLWFLSRALASHVPRGGCRG
ncbi:MAG: hypothetical protein JRF54_14640 [Deltaproteobacteria bacterium]|nr:hypothetical protein [Deltaproteobacteria bacterium]